jgi:hypothetical protein
VSPNLQLQKGMPLTINIVERYCNNITGSSQRSCPPEFRGGVLADQMGLGKSLTMISLIAADFGSLSEAPSTPISPSRSFKPGDATLLVVPLSRTYHHEHCCVVQH